MDIDIPFKRVINLQQKTAGVFMRLRDFRGEVWTNIHPDILKAMITVNDEIVDGNNGKDSHSKNADRLMQSFFSDTIYTTYTINGTAANVIALKAMCDRWSTIICAEQTHINTYECGATEYMLGNKILSIPSADGKLSVELIEKLLNGQKKYKYLPKVIVLTQPTEFGTVYTNRQIKEICNFAHSRNMYVYIDGARIANAIVELNTTLTEMIENTGVDAFSFGGTKAGALFGEMVVFRHREFAMALEYSQKQSLQHLDKSKFLGVQIEYLLQSGLWLENARISNRMAKILEQKLLEKGVKTFYPVQTNMVFAILTKEELDKINAVFDLHYWNETDKSVRIATTYLTTEQKIDELVSLI